MPQNKLKTLDELWQICQKPRTASIVWTNGCFDILHAGHIEYLEKARSFGDCLIVGLNSDKSIKELKGNDRPIIPQEQRIKVLSAIEFIDYIVLFNSIRPILELKTVQPDYFVKGGDYTIKSIDKEERKAIKSFYGEIKIVPIETDISDTWIINKIKSI